MTRLDEDLGDAGELVSPDEGRAARFVTELCDFSEMGEHSAAGRFDNSQTVQPEHFRDLRARADSSTKILRMQKLKIGFGRNFSAALPPTKRVF